MLDSRLHEHDTGQEENTVSPCPMNTFRIASNRFGMSIHFHCSSVDMRVRSVGEIADPYPGRLLFYQYRADGNDIDSPQPL